MIVCSCNVVSERTIVAVIAEGAADVDLVGMRCGAGTCCGGCQQEIESLLRRYQDARAPVAV